MDKPTIKLPVFEGPLDILLHLIQKNKLDIWDIPIIEITNQYLIILGDMSLLDLDVSSDFLVMAAHLIYIKSVMLLPRKKLEDDEPTEEELKEELARRLTEYQKYKQVCGFFVEREGYYEDNLFKLPEKLSFAPKMSVGMYNKVDLIEILRNAFVKKVKEAEIVIENPFEKLIGREKVSIEDKVHYIKEMLFREKSLPFNKLFEGMRDKNEMVATFLGLLDLIKINFVKVLIADNDGNIVITCMGNGDNDSGR